MASAALACEIVDTGIAIARQVNGALRAEQSKVETRSHRLLSMAENLERSAAEKKALARLLEKVLWVPFVRSKAIHKQMTSAATMTEEAFSKRAESKHLLEQSMTIAGQMTRSANVRSYLQKNRGLDFSSMGLPVETERRFESLRLQSTYLLRTPPGTKWNEKALKLSTDIAGTLQGWIRGHAETVKRRSAERQASAAAMGTKGAKRVYLPIHKALGPKAVELGAQTDKDAPYGTSPWFVTAADDLSKFRSMLPLAYRPNPTQFQFHPVPYRASGLNLWTFFDQSTWDLIRKTSYAMAGHRCMICGNRGGWISDKIMEPEDRRHGVECHEVWSWQTEDPESGIGVQKLQRLLVVCTSCHACFHSGHFISKARQKGMQDEVKAFIEGRRMSINRMDPDTLKASLADAKSELMAVNGIDNWVVDLDYLGRQQFMADVNPILRERNGPGVSGDMIAGLSFESESGQVFFNSSTDEVIDHLRRTIGDSDFRYRSIGTGHR